MWFRNFLAAQGKENGLAIIGEAVLCDGNMLGFGIFLHKIPIMTKTPGEPKNQSIGLIKNTVALTPSVVRNERHNCNREMSISHNSDGG